jgi:hypothetical protein
MITIVNQYLVSVNTNYRLSSFCVWGKTMKEGRLIIEKKSIRNDMARYERHAGRNGEQVSCDSIGKHASSGRWRERPDASGNPGRVPGGCPGA